MPKELTQGGNSPLAAGGNATISLSWSSTPVDLDIACFLLKADGKVISDDWMVFYNQTTSPGNAVQFSGGANAVTFQIKLDELPADIERCCFTATLDGASTVADIKGLSLHASAGGTELVFNPNSLGSEKALMVAEMYRHSTGWKIRAVAQGFNGGLAPLARHFGVSVEENAGHPTPFPTLSLVIPIDARILEQIRSNAAFVEKVISNSLGKQAGYGIEGVTWLDAFIQRQHDAADTAIHDQIVSAYGAYLGECIVKSVGGQWTEMDGAEAVAFDMNNAVFPFSKLRKHLCNGSEAGDSVLGYFTTVEALFKNFAR